MGRPSVQFINTSMWKTYIQGLHLDQVQNPFSVLGLVYPETVYFHYVSEKHAVLISAQSYQLSSKMAGSL